VLDLEKNAAERDRGLIEAALFDSARPVIIVPPGCETFAAGRILIAWDGCQRRPDRRRAQAVPAGAEVEILSVTGGRICRASSPAPNWRRICPAWRLRHRAQRRRVRRNDVAETTAGGNRFPGGPHRLRRLQTLAAARMAARRRHASLLKSTPLPLLMSR
jgi:hypothetical protein